MFVSNSKQYQVYEEKREKNSARETHVACRKNQPLFIETNKQTNAIKHVDILPVKCRGVTFCIFDRFLCYILQSLRDILTRQFQ